MIFCFNFHPSQADGYRFKKRTRRVGEGRKNMRRRRFSFPEEKDCQDSLAPCFAARRLASGITPSLSLPGLMKGRGAQDPPVPGMTQDLWSSFSLYPLPALARSCFSPASDEEGEAEESGDLLSAQKVPRGEILGSRRSQSCSGNRLSKGNDWTGPDRPTGWRTLVLLRSLPTIYSPPSPRFARFPFRNLCSIPAESFLPVPSTCLR